MAVKTFLKVTRITKKKCKPQFFDFFHSCKKSSETAQKPEVPVLPLLTSKFILMFSVVEKLNISLLRTLNMFLIYSYFLITTF